MLIFFPHFFKVAFNACEPRKKKIAENVRVIKVINKPKFEVFRVITIIDPA